MTNCGGGQRFLTEARDQIGIVAYQIGKDDFDCMLGLQKDVPRFEDHAHAALSQSLFKLIAAIEDRFTRDRCSCGRAVVRTKGNVIGETITTSWALFHALVRLLHHPARVKSVRKRILAAVARASKKLLP